MKKLILFLVILGGNFLSTATAFAGDDGGKDSKWVKLYFDTSTSSPFDCDQSKVTAILGEAIPFFDSNKNDWSVAFIQAGRISFTVGRDNCITLKKKINREALSCGVTADFRVSGSRILEMRNFVQISPGAPCF